ncbi:MAG: hypothetical protein HYV07_09070 [Deltaproteobacteria bacterium]|nr:hypothetical protein [Deltaproteobacteria bacterium]
MNPKRLGLAFLTAAACGTDATTNSGSYGTSVLPAPAGADAQFVSSTIPLAMHPGENLNVTVKMLNSGTTTWDGEYRLHRVGVPLWNWVNTKVPGTAIPGSQKAIRFVIRAPGAAPTPYTFDAQMFNQSLFGEEVLIEPIFVSDSTPRRWGCEWLRADPANIVPTTLTVGETFPARFRLRNTGTNPWHRGENRCGGDPPGDRGTFLVSQDDKTAVGQFNFWGVPSTQLLIGNDLASGNFIDITVPITANANVQRTEAFRFARQIYDCRPPNPDPNGGVGFLQGGSTSSNFEACIDLNITVTLCGNGVIDAIDGEECDDGNRANGDGCSDTCRIVDTTNEIDLATDAVGRTFGGSQAQKQLGGVVEVAGQRILMGEIATVVPPTGSFRNVAGKVYGFAVAPTLLDGSVTRLPNGNPDFQFWGADANDMLGHVEGHLASGQIDGVGGVDLALSVPYADGLSNTLADAGEVWVFALDGLSGIVDLRTGTSHPSFVARIVGAAAGARIRALGVTRAGQVVIGSPGTNQVLIVGGASGALSGTIDLASPSGVLIDVLQGPAAGVFGSIGAVAELSGDANDDVAVTAPSFNRSQGLDRAGRAAVVFGPFTGGRVVSLGLRAGTAGAPDVVILGSTLNGRLGTSLAVGQVKGGVEKELVIGESQARKSGDGTAQFGRCLVISAPAGGHFVAGTDIDFTSAVPSAVSVWARNANDLGGSVCALGDVNFDGFKDVAMGAGGSDGPTGTRTQAGAILVAVGSNGMTSIDFAVTSPAAELFGRHQSAQLAVQPFSVALVDIDGDDHDELVAGSWQGGNTLFPGVTRPGEVVLVSLGL